MTPENMVQYTIAGNITDNTSNHTINITGSTSYGSFYFRSNSNDSYVQYDQLNFNITTDYYQFKIYNNSNINYELSLLNNDIDSLNTPVVTYNSYTYPNILVTISASANIPVISTSSINILDITSSLNLQHSILHNIIYSDDVNIYYTVEGN